MSKAIVAADQAGNLIDDWASDIRSALPPNISFARMRATFITAVAHNPEILTCDPQSIRTALLKAATDNLLPDNREAAIVPYNTRIKENDKEVWKKLAQYLPMVQGIRKRAKELGGIKTIICEVVYAQDFFEYEAGDDPKIVHKPPKLGSARGDIIGAYSIFKDDTDFVVHREVMSTADIETARNVSKAKDGPAWKNFYSEMCRKTVVRRGAKSVPSIPEELRTIIERDDEMVDFQSAPGKTIEGNANPLLEHDPGERVSMDRGASSEERQPAQRQTETRQHEQQQTRQKNTNSDSRPRSSEGDGGGGSGSTAKHAAPVFEEFSAAMMRFANGESLKKGSTAFWNDKGGLPEDKAEYVLGAAIYELHEKRSRGELTPDEVKAEVSKKIEEAFKL